MRIFKEIFCTLFGQALTPQNTDDGPNGPHKKLSSQADFLPVLSNKLTISLMKIDITGSAFELAELMKENRSLIEKDLSAKGNEVIAFFADENFSDSFKNLKSLKIELFKMALEDLAMGAITLKTSTIGLAYKDGQVKTYITPHGKMPSGNVMCSLALKNVVAFKNWRAGEEAEIPQEELNAAIYRLSILLSEII